jgi:DNA replication protein DnaC
MERLPNKLEKVLMTHIREQGKTTVEQLGERVITCSSHGDYKSSGVRYLGKHEVWSHCPDCEELALTKEREAKAQAEAEAKAKQIERMIGDACIPARFVGRTFETFKADDKVKSDALAVVRSYADNFPENFKKGGGLILSGLPGTGKSHLAAAALQAIFPKYNGIYTNCLSYIRNIRCSWRKDSEQSEIDVVSTYRFCDLLVLDEVGVQYGTEGEQTILFDLLDGRYRDMKPTILITNQDKAGFKAYIGDRVFDRLVETSRWVAFDWPSYRPEARKAAS